MTEAQREPGLNPDFELLFRRVREGLLKGENPDQIRDILKREDIVQHLNPAEGLEWARFAQMLGEIEIAIGVLAALNERFPGYDEAWLEHWELLIFLSRRQDALALRAKALLARPELEKRLQLKLESEVSLEPQKAPDIEEPFLRAKKEELILRRYMQLFEGREDCFARQWVDKEAGSSGYMPVRRPIAIQDVRDHILGRKTYGIYLLQQDGRIRVGVLDADLKPEERLGEHGMANGSGVSREADYLIERVQSISKDYHLVPLVEFTGGKGYHFWYIFSEPVDPAPVRKVLGQIAGNLRKDLQFFNLEVFPKQDRLSGKGLGNLVKLPLGIHRVTGKASYFLPKVEGDIWQQLDILEDIRPNTLEWMEHNISPPETKVYLHPRQSDWLSPFPELRPLIERCPALGNVIVGLKNARSISIREEKVLLGTIGFMKRGKSILHTLFQNIPEYNPHLLDYKLSIQRGSPLGCKKIHNLLELNLDYCDFTEAAPYPHPLLHLKDDCVQDMVPVSERIENLHAALENLMLGIQTVLRFLPENTRLLPLEQGRQESENI